MTASLRFLIKFVLVSALVFMFWMPLSRGYFAFLSLETNAVFGLLGHGARLEQGDLVPHLVYHEISLPNGSKKNVRIPIYQSIAIHFNLVVLLAMFAAIPGMPPKTKIKGIWVGVLLLSLSHIAHVYFISYLFIWGYVAQQHGLAGVSKPEFQALVNSVERGFPLSLYGYIKGIELYWNSFFQEAWPLLIWFYFAYSWIAGREFPQGPTARTIAGRSETSAARATP